MTNKPEKVFKAGNCQASVFIHTVQKGEKKIEMPSISFQKRYMDKNNKWQGTGNLGLNDIPKAVVVLEEAFKWCLSQKKVENEETPEEEGSETPEED